MVNDVQKMSGSEKSQQAGGSREKQQLASYHPEIFLSILFSACNKKMKLVRDCQASCCRSSAHNPHLFLILIPAALEAGREWGH